MQINYWIGVAVQRRELKQALQLVPLPKLCANLKMEMWELRDGPPLFYKLPYLDLFILSLILFFFYIICFVGNPR